MRWQEWYDVHMNTDGLVYECGDPSALMALMSKKSITIQTFLRLSVKAVVITQQ